MTILQALKAHHKIEIDLLLCHVLGKSKEFLYLHPEKSLSASQQTTLKALIKRRIKGEPMAYILGYKDFYGLRFKVSKDVLVPRPETEWFVEKIVQDVGADLIRPSEGKMGSSPTPIKILDLGTGSGAIIISLARALSESPSPFRGRVRGGGVSFYATDISKKALSIAKFNAVKHKVKIKFIQSNLLKNINFNPDIIVANLPYGWKEWKNNTTIETVGLKFEPKEALFTKEQGLYFYRKLLEQISNRLKDSRFRGNDKMIICLEFDPRQKQKLHKLIKKYLPGWKVNFYKDFNSLWRYAEIKR